MSNPQVAPDEEPRVEAEGVDPDIPTTDPDEPSSDEDRATPSEEDEIEVEDLP